MRRLGFVLSALLPLWTACLSGCPVAVDQPTSSQENDRMGGGGGGGGGAY